MSSSPSTLTRRAGMVALTALALGGWLFISPYVLDYPASDARTDAFLNAALGAVVAGALGVVALRWDVLAIRAGVVGVAVGAWLMLAPFVIGYGSAVPDARVNHLVCGALLIGIGIALIVPGSSRTGTRGTVSWNDPSEPGPVRPSWTDPGERIQRRR